MNINSRTLDEIQNYLERSLFPEEWGVKAITTIGLSYVDYARENTNLWSALFDFHHPENTDLPEWYVEKVNSVFSIPVKALVPLFNGDAERAMDEARIIWGGVHGICLLGLTHRLSHDSEELLKTKVRSLIENYIRGLNLNCTISERATGY